MSKTKSKWEKVTVNSNLNHARNCLHSRLLSLSNGIFAITGVYGSLSKGLSKQERGLPRAISGFPTCEGCEVECRLTADELKRLSCRSRRLTECRWSNVRNRARHPNARPPRKLRRRRARRLRRSLARSSLHSFFRLVRPPVHSFIRSFICPQPGFIPRNYHDKSPP